MLIAIIFIICSCSSETKESIKTICISISNPRILNEAQYYNVEIIQDGNIVTSNNIPSNTTVLAFSILGDKKTEIKVTAYSAENIKIAFGNWSAKHIETDTIQIELKEVIAENPAPNPDPTIYTVTFIVDNVEYAVKQVSASGTVELPNPPQKNGYIFQGWFAEKSYTKFEGMENIKSNMTVMAKWISSTKTVFLPTHCLMTTYSNDGITSSCESYHTYNEKGLKTYSQTTITMTNTNTISKTTTSIQYNEKNSPSTSKTLSFVNDAQESKRIINYINYELGLYNEYYYNKEGNITHESIVEDLRFNEDNQVIYYKQTNKYKNQESLVNELYFEYDPFTKINKENRTISNGKLYSLTKCESLNEIDHTYYSKIYHEKNGELVEYGNFFSQCDENWILKKLTSTTIFDTYQMQQIYEYENGFVKKNINKITYDNGNYLESTIDYAEYGLPLSATSITITTDGNEYLTETKYDYTYEALSVPYDWVYYSI